MADTMANEPKISIKAIADKEKNRVLYAEADYTFVDILFSFMTLPMGAIVRLLEEQADKKFEALGSLNNLYHSLVDLPECYFLTEECKLMLLNPRSPSYDRSTELILKTDDIAPTKYFCGKFMDREIHFKDTTHSADADRVGCGVFVSNITTFIVTDDLCVMPHTPGCCIQLLIDHGVTDTSHLEERTVELGREKGKFDGTLPIVI
ncbi:RNA-directed DNA polymerase, eukaryota, reverse transcriptase zinc-binding domain protein [Tanacetum coccineum]